MATLMPTMPSDMLQMLSRMERLFGGMGTSGEDEGTLALDIYEENDALFVEASVPGFERDDIAIQLHQGLLSIVASRPAQPDGTEHGRRYFRRERPAGAWTRRIALPGVVHDAEVDAELKDGVLKLTIPIPASAKPRQIAIRTDGAEWDGQLTGTVDDGDQHGS
jgi:HSP20 family protein